MKIKTPLQILSVAVLIVICSSPAMNAFAQEENHLEISDYLNFEQVNDAQLSPDGRQVIYTRRWVDQKSDNWKSALWIMDADGSRHRFLIDGSNARWSPSGDRILTAQSLTGHPALLEYKSSGFNCVIKSCTLPRSHVLLA